MFIAEHSPEFTFAKRYLEQSRRADALVDKYTEQLTRLKASTTKATQAISTDFTGTGASPNPHRLEVTIANIEQLEASLLDALGELTRAKEDVSRVISHVSSTVEAEVLASRYLNGKRWEEIAVDMRYSYQGVRRAHDRGVESVAAILKRH